MTALSHLRLFPAIPLTFRGDGHGDWTIGRLARLATATTATLAAVLTYAVASRPMNDDLFIQVASASNTFALGEISFAMTAADIRSAYPDAKASTTEAGHVVTHFRSDGADMVVWFSDDDHGRGAYRIREERTLTHLTGPQVHARLYRLYGRPMTIDCRRHQVASGESCRFQWWLEDGIHVDAVCAISDSDEDLPRIRLTTVAVDPARDPHERNAALDTAQMY